MMHHKHTNCQEILEHLNDYIDGDLDSTLCEHLESHLETCTNCQVVHSTLMKTIELCLRDGERTSLPPDARRRLFASLGLEDHVNQDRT